MKSFSLLVVFTLAVLVYALFDFFAPGPLEAPVTLLFERGQGFQAMSASLEKSGVIRNKYLFEAEAVLLGSARKFKAGEYEFSPSIPTSLVMDMIAQGRVVIHKITVPEGLTVREVTELLKAEPLLTGDVPEGIEEGELLPETYHFTYGDKRADLIERMEAARNKTLAELWEHRKEGLPYKDPEEAVTMASIVEKETGVPQERGHVASVFINRLRIGMKLQTDPTVIYAIEHDKGEFGRALTRDDLAYDSPYNTYKITGLPPGPIANPGRAAIEAVLNPPDTKDLYFVATGTGGHNFAATVAEHNANVRKYREQEKKNQ